MHQKLRTVFFLTGMLLLAARVCPAAGTIPFKPGEQLQYSIYWEDIAAGVVTFEVKPMAAVNGIPAYHFTMSSATSPFLSAILMISDRVESYADIGMAHALLYKERNSGTTAQDVTVTFDWKKQEAQYSFNGKKYRPSPLVPGAFDPLSVLYALRLLDLKGIQEISRPVSDGLACVVVRAKVPGKQKVRVESGEYDAYVVEPQLAGFSKIFDMLSGATVKLWISADERRLPVKIMCGLPLGNFTAELKSSKAGN
ncbi:MAG: DUF3108 domain-containing protein [Deltaproteobacteria bacterium]|nr:DUF3108 domain-containing protein [Deltaproteobacteria bacterium]